MTSKEALRELVLKYNVPQNVLEPLRLLDKCDTPMKVNSHAGSIFREYKCHCGQHFNSFYHLVEINFCPKCGQRLDWSNE